MARKVLARTEKNVEKIFIESCDNGTPCYTVVKQL